MCVEKNKRIKHPVTGELVVNEVASFCAIDPVYENGKVIIVDECDMKKNPENIDPDILASMSNPDLLNPVSQFNPRYFLMRYYNINTINDFYKWFASNKNAPVFTRTRVVDCFMSGFVDQITVLDETFVDIIIQLIKQFWIKEIYGKLSPYVGIVDDKCVIMMPDKNKLKRMDSNEIRAKYIVNEIFNRA
jgi:hypothetical protein